MSFVGRCCHSSSLISAYKRMHGVSSCSVASFSFYSNSINSLWRYNDSLISNSSNSSSSGSIYYSNNSRLFFSVDVSSGKKETKKDKNEASKAAAAVSKGAKKANSGDKKMTTDEIEAQV